MDYKNHKEGYSESNFYIQGKKDLIDILLSKLKKRNLRILNLGAGVGNEMDILCKYGIVYASDINKAALNIIPKKLCFKKTVEDACNLHYKDNFFDVVVSFDLFEHIDNDTKSALEAHRVLKKGGCLIFTVPAFQFLFSSHDKALDHKRRYSKKTLKKLLSPFHSLRLNYWNSILFFPIACMRLLNRRKKGIDHFEVSKPINSLFYSILKLENIMIKHGIHIPIGLTIVGYCKKENI